MVRTLSVCICETTILKPRFGFSAYPIHRLAMELEGIDLFNGAIRPFGLDSPVITVAQHHAKNGLSRHHANHARTRWPGAAVRVRGENDR